MQVSPSGGGEKMSKGEGVISVIPVEETIIDPLYEPLKLNRYPLCEDLQQLKDVSHLRYGFSPYLLFDVAGMREVIQEIGKKSEKEIDDIFIPFGDKLRNYLENLKKLPGVTNKDRNELYKDLEGIRNEIKGIYDGIKENYQDSLNESLYSSSEFKEREFDKIAHLFRLEYPVKVTCPICGKEQYMCEEGKIYSMKEALLRTFELRRAKWLYLSGSLHTVHRASTHTRLSHEIGSLIVGVNALYEIDVYLYKDFSMLFGEYLLMRGDLHEFLMANFLHDIGHPPLSHVLEPNPFIELDHEKITRNLILGEENIAEKGEIDWYVALNYLLKMKAISDFESRFFINQYDPIYNIPQEEIEEELKKGEDQGKTELSKIFLEYIEKNNREILESEIVTVSSVLDNFGINRKRVVEILTGECKNKKDIKKIYDTQVLNKLIDSDIDFDRIDHVKRDSEVCGLSLTSFRLLEILGSMSVALPDSKAHDENIFKSAEEKEIPHPYIFISEKGLKYVMDLLNSRRAIFNEVLYSDENNWINGVINQIVMLIIKYLPHLRDMLPFITDETLSHFIVNDLFLGTQIEKLVHLFHGKQDYSAYGEPKRYKLKEDKKEGVTNDMIEAIYRVVEKKNEEEKYMPLQIPAFVFYTNIKIKKPKKAENGDRDKEGEWDDVFVYGKRFNNGYYCKFKDLLAKNDPYKVYVHKKTKREVFPLKPSERETKNLLYIWVCNLIGTKEEKEKLIEAVEEAISAEALNREKFDNWFADLDDVDSRNLEVI